LTDPAFMHLMFVFPTSAIQATFGGTTGNSWSPSLIGATTLNMGGYDLAEFMCGDSAAWSTGIPCTGSGFLLGLGASDASEVMMVGFSNGGAMSIYANWYYPGTVSKAVAIDFYGQLPGFPIAPSYFSTPATNLDVTVYTACGSATYGTSGIFDGQILSAASVTADGMAPATYGGLDFQEWSYSSSIASWKHSIHGLDPADSSVCASPTTPSGSTNGWVVHGAMPDVVKDACIDNILDWVTPPPEPGAPTEPGAPSPPAYNSENVPDKAVAPPEMPEWGLTRQMMIDQKVKRLSKLALPRSKASRFAPMAMKF